MTVHYYAAGILTSFLKFGTHLRFTLQKIKFVRQENSNITFLKRVFLSLFLIYFCVIWFDGKKGKHLNHWIVRSRYLFLIASIQSRFKELVKFVVLNKYST